MHTGEEGFKGFPELALGGSACPHNQNRVCSTVPVLPCRHPFRRPEARRCAGGTPDDPVGVLGRLRLLRLDEPVPERRHRDAVRRHRNRRRACPGSSSMFGCLGVWVGRTVPVGVSRRADSFHFICAGCMTTCAENHAGCCQTTRHAVAKLPCVKRRRTALRFRHKAHRCHFHSSQEDGQMHFRDPFCTNI